MKKTVTVFMPEVTRVFTEGDNDVTDIFIESANGIKYPRIVFKNGEKEYHNMPFVVERNNS